VLAAVCIATPTALAGQPTIKTLKGYLEPSGPDKGTVTVILTAGYRHFATKADVPQGKRPPRTWAILRLNDGTQTILAADTYRLSPPTRSSWLLVITSNPCCRGRTRGSLVPLPERLCAYGFLPTIEPVPRR